MMQEVSETKLHKKGQSADFYQKIDENYRIQTSGGAVVSLIGWIVIAILFMAEVNNYLTPHFQEHMIVDSSLGQQLRAHLDAMDVAGDNQLNVEHEMMKQRISSKGVPIGKPGIEIIGEGPLPQIPLPPDYCGSCFGAETETVKCCNTCDELVKHYQMKQWSIVDILRNSTQCLRDRASHFATVGADEGCRVSGVMNVNKVAGNVHIAHGESIVRDGKHIHQFNPATAIKYNISHTIHSLSFGTPYPSMPSNPLDKTVKIIGEKEQTGLFQYFIRVIPTVYTNEFGGRIMTNQYTVSDRFRPLAVPQFDANGMMKAPTEAILPGIFFVYELSPFMIEASRTRPPLLHVATKLCAIVGGVFTVLGVFDSILFKLLKF